ncbi:MAG TPA: serine hydrolase domain-containing protein [Thermotogota bacterium]|nr:serine hydrolase domain-containing protein [Thermotogota bacterium]HRW93553.1 serine hydrolase domain-containing protein [Thermotogota bacterium]
MECNVSEWVQELFEEQIKSNLFPGGALMAGSSNGTVFEGVYGTLDGERPVERNTLYDMASVTKVFATLPAMLILMERGKVDIEDRVSRFLPSIPGDILIRHLLTHTSGMPPYSIAYRTTHSPEELMAEILQTPQTLPAGREVVYSCLNFILSMKVIECITGNFREFVQKNVFEALGLLSTGFLPEENTNIAPTSERDGVRLVGKPDDELAYYLGGVSGNAGVFSTVGDLFAYAQEWIRPDLFVSPVTAFQSSCDWTSPLQGDRRGLGWLLKDTRSSCGPLFSPGSFGHTGFTGTSLWMDPNNDFIVVLLTNRCFFQRHERIEDMWFFRRKLHSLLLSAYQKGYLYPEE